MSFFREISKRLPGIVGILFLVYLGALLFAPHPSGWEKVFRQIARWTGLLMLLVVFIAALAIGAKALVARIARALRGGHSAPSDSIGPRSDAISKKQGFFAKIAGGIEQYTINFFDLSLSSYWYAIVFAYESFQMFQVHNDAFAVYSLLCCFALGIDSLVRLAKEPGFFTRLWFGYMFLGLTVLTVCIDASKPGDIGSVVLDIISFGALSFAGFYGHYRSSERIATEAVALVSSES